MNRRVRLLDQTERRPRPAERLHGIGCESTADLFDYALRRPPAEIRIKVKMRWIVSRVRMSHGRFLDSLRTCHRHRCEARPRGMAAASRPTRAHPITLLRAPAARSARRWQARHTTSTMPERSSFGGRATT